MNSSGVLNNVGNVRRYHRFCRLRCVAAVRDEIVNSWQTAVEDFHTHKHKHKHTHTNTHKTQTHTKHKHTQNTNTHKTQTHTKHTHAHTHTKHTRTHTQTRTDFSVRQQQIYNRFSSRYFKLGDLKSISPRLRLHLIVPSVRCLCVLFSFSSFLKEHRQFQ